MCWVEHTEGNRIEKTMYLFQNQRKKLCCSDHTTMIAEHVNDLEALIMKLKEHREDGTKWQQIPATNLKNGNEFIAVVDSFHIIGLTIKNEETSSQEIFLAFSLFSFIRVAMKALEKMFRFQMCL